MTEETKKTEEIKENKQSPEYFDKQYIKLCEETGYRISVTPVWIPRDDNTWSLVMQPGRTKLPPKIA